MRLAKNTRFGPYEIIALLGASGMAEVYRARPATEREVALKLLPNAVAADPNRRHRFEVEAHSVAALNHSKIIAIYDVGIEDGTSYIVTELIDGERLRPGAPPCGDSRPRGNRPMLEYNRPPCP